MRRFMIPLVGAILAFLLLAGTLGVAARTFQPSDFQAPDFGRPAPSVSYTPTVVQIDEARAAVDYPVPIAGWLPAGTTLAGAFFPMPSWDAMYPNAPASARAELALRNRLRPIGLLYSGPSGGFTISRTSIGVGVPTVGSSFRPYGLDQVTGDRRAVDGFEYVVRRGVQASLLLGNPSFPSGAQTMITWRGPLSTAMLPGGLRMYDIQWTITGTLSEDDLLRVARSFG